MTQLDFESDAFLSLLTDALRAGPGSPEWHEALARLRAGGIEFADEYRLLVTAREHLESGKRYRSVRAGPAFTRRLMESLDRGGSPTDGRAISPAAIATACGLVMLAVLILIGYFVYTAPRPTTSNNQGTTLLVDTVTVAGFSGSLPADWQRIGALDVEFVRSAMKPVVSQNAPGAGGGVWWTKPIPATEPFALLASLRIEKLEPDLITQVFVTDEPVYDADNATTPRELVWLLQSNHVQVVLPNGRVEARSDVPADLTGNLGVRISIDQQDAQIESGDSVIWSGRHELDPSKPRYVGVRFLRASERAGAGVVVASVRVNMRPK